MIKENFKKIYNTEADFVIRAPGRLEILGNHTDYNEGYVLSVAVDKETHFAVSANEGKECSVYTTAVNHTESKRVFDIDNIHTPLAKDWSNYIRGILHILQKNGHKLQAFNAYLDSTVPLSAGMSSSASVEMATVLAMKILNHLDIDKLTMAKIGQKCENDYVGANTGLMDQLSSMMGKKNHLVFSEYRNLDIQNISFSDKCSFVVANTGVKHDLTTEYNDRRKQCENALAALQKKYPNAMALRDISIKQLESSKEILDVLDYKRALHVIGENERVLQGVELLKEDKLKEFGQLMYESQESSIHNFENSCVELDNIIHIAKNSGLCLGARLSGGGFGGITVNLVYKQDAQKFCNYLKNEYQKQANIDCEPLVCSAADGASLKD